MNWNNSIVLALVLMVNLSTFAAGKNSDPVIATFQIDKFERRSTEGKDFNVLEGQVWMGKDIDKFRLKVNAEFTNDNTDSAEVQLVYSRAVARYWDAQIGYRRDLYPKPENEFLVLGFVGMAPYHFEIDAQLFIGDGGQAGVRIEAEYELLLTQNRKWVLVPEFEINAYLENDEALGIGSGLSDIELGLRLNYFINRQIAPYVGVAWEKKFGNTADLVRADGQLTNDVQYIIGLHGWF